MGKTRICGKRCHDAVRGKCRCWCGGTFHGTHGQVARLEFARTFALDRLPTTEAAFKHMTQPNFFSPEPAAWRDRIDAAVATQKK